VNPSNQNLQPRLATAMKIALAVAMFTICFKLIL